jgi:uncharacterized membrane protein YgcG
MKNIKKILFSLAIFLLWQVPVLARDNVTDWYIKDFKTEIVVNRDSSLNVTEKILADCGLALDKHGIFRIFPKEYKTKTGNFILPMELISITDKNGRKVKYSTIADASTITYKIGDPDINVQGENFYEIKYVVKNVILTGNKDFDELYWNILGNYWDLEIDNFSADIVFPVEINQHDTRIDTYAGALNSKDSGLLNVEWTTNNSLQIETQKTFSRREGITLSVTFPKNIITPYKLTFADKFGYPLFEIVLALLFPLLAFIACFYFWYKYGRDPHFKKTVVPEFEIPENLTPVEMGGIMKKGSLHNDSITATIIRLGFLGYLKIEKQETKILFVKVSDFKLIRTDKAVGADLYKTEEIILAELFKTGNDIALAELKNKFYKSIPRISKSILNDLSKRNLVGKAGAQYRTFMITAATLIFIIPGSFKEPLLIISGLATAFIMLFFAFFMDKLTIKGSQLNWRIKGFKLYMETAEKYRSQFQEKEGIIEKLLPYAILFNLTKEWLVAMKNIYGEEYFNNYCPVFMIGGFNASDFSNFSSTINELSSSITANVSASASGSAGGGGAGGGGGGGGGGGW